jgi:hypothetical protein
MATLDRSELFRVRSRGFLAIALIQLAILAVLVVNNRNLINVDPICYIRTAHYYHSGNWDLAISSYWSPMTSWLMVPLLSVFDNPFDAGPIVTAIMAVIFLLGSAFLIQAMELSNAYGLGAAFTCAVASAQWAGEGLGGDVLLAGLTSAAIAVMIQPLWITGVRAPVLVGLLFGVGFLTKSVALPLSIVLGAAFAIMHTICGVSWSTVLRSYLLTVAVATLIAAPWIIAISLNSGSFTIGTSALAAHAVTAPGIFNTDTIANKTIDVVSQPEAGRLTRWEDPPIDSFLRWSPLASLANLKHQLYVIARNFMKLMDLLAAMDLLHLGLAAAIFAFFIHGPWRSSMAKHRWRWCLIPIVLLAAPYLPVYTPIPRYLYPVFPCLVIAALGFSGTLVQAVSGRTRILSHLALVLVVGSFLFPSAWRLGALMPGRVENTSAPRDLAQRLRQAGLDGPVAASHNHPVEALYVAYFLDQPLHEYDPLTKDVARLAASGAKALIVPRESRFFDQLTCDPCFESLDEKLYDDPSQAAQNGIAAFAIRADCVSTPSGANSD